MFMTGSLGLKV